MHVRNSRESPDKCHEPGSKAMLFNPVRLGKISEALSAEREEIPESRLEHPHFYSHEGRDVRWGLSLRN